jgi:hypothetical protein
MIEWWYKVKQEELPMVKYDASTPQLSFIVSLACERGFTYRADTNTLTRRETTIELSKQTKRHASNLITWLKEEPKQQAATQAPKRLATERQVDYLVSLADRAGWEVEDTKVTKPEGTEVELTALSVGVASELIDELRKAPRSRSAKRNPNIKITEDGMYRLDGEIYKVQVAVHGSGHLYAKRLVIDYAAVRDADGNITAPGQGHYERDASAMAKLLPEHRLTVADAKGFGDLYGMCIRCAATLTDEESIAAGAGRICRGKI